MVWIPKSQVCLRFISDYLLNTPCVAGRILNQSHQVQIALRVITREMDSTSVIRPDNL